MNIDLDNVCSLSFQFYYTYEIFKYYVHHQRKRHKYIDLIVKVFEDNPDT